MQFDPSLAHTLLLRVNPGRLRAGKPVGLRDGAVLALIAAGLSTVEIAALRAAAITIVGGRPVVILQRRGVAWAVGLPKACAARVFAWLDASGLRGRPEPAFRGCRGPLTPMGIFKIVDRYRNRRQPACRKAA